MLERSSFSESEHVPDRIAGEGFGAGHAICLEGLRRSMLEDGREVLVAGDVDTGKKAFEFQGNNESKFVASGGLAAVASLLRLSGIDVTYSDVVAFAARHDLCTVERDANGRIDPERSGATTAAQRAKILESFGIEAKPARVESLGQIADAVVGGQAVMVSVNAGILWKGLAPGSNFDAHYGNGEHNHVVGVIGVAFDPVTRAVVGFYVNDPAELEGAGRFVSADVMKSAVIGTEAQPVHGEMIAARGNPRSNA